MHFRRANPLIPFESLRLQVAASRMPWPAREDEVARAGVSAFGWGGTNCHVVLEAGEVAPAQIVPLAAETPAALIAAATELRAQAADPAGPLFPELCRAAALRARGRHRLAITARTRGELASKLDGFLEGRTVAGLASGEAPEQTPRIAFVLSPQGGQWLGMGRELMRTEPAFRAKIEACDAAIRRHGGWSLIEELSSDVVGPRSSEVDRIQPATFAVQVALAALLESWGVLPGTVVGHSLGEIGAAHLAGILDLDDAARVICHYSRLQATTAGNGGMAQFVGKVVELSGAPNPAGQLEGDVVLQVQADDQLLKVRVTLGPDDYRKAGAAHLGQHYVSVHGQLHRGRRTHALKNPTGFDVLPP